ncbi:hypothetical protein BX070DRAFT_218572 [Coemansia spiralis]|nr:hypothetical protein BX070DRAFT_218572 [Coemansia spiralis]
MKKLPGFAVMFALPLISSALSSAPSLSALSSSINVVESNAASARYAGPTPGPPVKPPQFHTGTTQGFYDQYEPRILTSSSHSSSSSSSYDYSFGVNLSGFDGSITHYYVSYSDPYVSGAVGVGPSDPTPTQTQIITEGVVCDKKFPGLLSGLGLDLGLRLNLLLIGIDACVAL